MTDSRNPLDPARASEFTTADEGGLRPPPDLSPLRRLWWWFDFIILVKLARLRFVAILVVIGVAITQWNTINAYIERWTRGASGVQAAASDTEFFCPMHPAIVRDNSKEKCPICFMPLSKRKKGAGTIEALPAGIVNRVQLSPYRVVLAGVETWQVSYQPLTKEISTVGYVEFNERGLKNVSARVAGRIDKLVVSETGQTVQAGDELASLYSPDLNVTVQNLIDAKRRGNSEGIASSRNRLQLLGIGGDQLDEIERTGKANSHLRIRSPIAGHVIKKYVREGQYVEEGTPLYDVADLSTVWIQAQVYEDDLAFLPVSLHEQSERIEGGLPVTVTTRAYPNDPLRGSLTFIYPHVDQETRTVTVRFELPNPEHRLRPGSTATVKIQIPPKSLPHLSKSTADENSVERRKQLEQGLVLAIPESAVIDTGSQKIVYRMSQPGVFEGVLVELGPRMTGPHEMTFYPLLNGLEAEDQIVTAGSFLVDAETRLNPAAGSIYFGGSAGKTAQASTVRPSTPEDADAKLDAVLTKLPAADRILAKAQRFCPILPSSALGSMGVPVKISIDGESVFVCCKGCTDEAEAKSKETLAKVKKLREKKN